MNKGGSLDHISIDTAQAISLLLTLLGDKPLCYSTTDLRYFKSMRQAIMEDDAFCWGNNLSYVCETSPSSGIQDAISVSLELGSIVGLAIIGMASLLTLLGERRHNVLSDSLSFRREVLYAGKTPVFRSTYVPSSDHLPHDGAA